MVSQTKVLVKLFLCFYVVLFELIREFLQSLKIFNGDSHFFDFLYARMLGKGRDVRDERYTSPSMRLRSVSRMTMSSELSASSSWSFSPSISISALASLIRVSSYDAFDDARH